MWSVMWSVMRRPIGMARSGACGVIAARARPHVVTAQRGSPSWRKLGCRRQGRRRSSSACRWLCRRTRPHPHEQAMAEDAGAQERELIGIIRRWPTILARLRMAGECPCGHLGGKMCGLSAESARVREQGE